MRGRKLFMATLIIALFCLFSIMQVSAASSGDQSDQYIHPLTINSPSEINNALKEGKGLVFTGIGAGVGQGEVIEHRLLNIPEDGFLFLETITDNSLDTLTCYYNTNRSVESWHPVIGQRRISKGTHYVEISWRDNGDGHNSYFYLYFIPASKLLTISQTLSSDKSYVTLSFSSPSMEYANYKYNRGGNDFREAKPEYSYELLEGKSVKVTENGRHTITVNWSDGPLWGECTDCARTVEVTGIVDASEKKAADKKAADGVIAKINAIGTVAYTTTSKGKIDAARTAYNGLSSAQKALVTNVNVLNAAEKKYSELKAAAEAAAKKKAAEEAAKKKAAEEAAKKKASLEKITIEKTPSSVKAKAKKNKVTVSWKKIKKNKAGKKLLKQINSIQVQYSTDKSFKKDVKTKTVGKKKTKVTLKLQKKTTYFFRVRYKGANGFSKWSKVKKVKTK